MPTSDPPGKPPLPEVVELLRELTDMRLSASDDTARRDWIVRKNALLARLAADPRATPRSGLPAS